jgi:hypothetical protein
MAHELAGALQQVSRIRQRRAVKKTHVYVRGEYIHISEGRISQTCNRTAIMQKLPDFVPAFSHHLKPLMRDGSQFTCMLFHPPIDGRIPLDSAIESQQFRSHRRSTFLLRDLRLRSLHEKDTGLSFPAERTQQQEDLARSRPVNPEAFDAYLQGYHHWQRDTDKDTDIAAKYFERATQIDPSYALAWAWLSRARNWQANEGLIPMEEGRRLSREAIERALALNPNLAAAHAQMGRIKQQVDYDWAGAMLPSSGRLLSNQQTPKM